MADDSGLPPPPEGIRVWRNTGNGIPVVRVHYTADADKRSGKGREELRRIKAQIGDAAFRREYEISFESPGGEPVIPEFDSTRMVRRLTVISGARPLRGWDFGHECPVVLFGQLDPWGRLQMLREVILQGASLEGLISAAKAATVDLWGVPRDAFDAGDPAAEIMTDLGMIKQILAEHGIILHSSRQKSHQDRAGSYAAFRSLLQQEVIAGTEGRTPKYLVDGAGCPMLVRALSGAFHKSPRHPYEPVPVHPFKDLVDAQRYLWDNLRGGDVTFTAKMREAATMDEVLLRWRSA